MDASGPELPRRPGARLRGGADTEENRAFFVEFKNQLKTRFRQLDL
jgi:hypothetical protein